LRIYYKNHLNEKVDLDSKNIILQYHELLNYSWNAETNNGRKIVSFYRESATIPIKVTVTADTEETFREVIENFYSIVEKDVLNRIPGKLYVGEQYMSCYISGDIKSDVFLKVFIQVKNLTVVTDNPFWIKETEFNFKITDITSTDNKQYPYKYPYRYANGMNNTYIINPHFTEANFKLRIYGPIVNPQIGIGGYPYLVNIMLEKGEYLEINSMKETVEKVAVNGERESVFHNRAKKKSIFKKVPPGKQEIVWPGTFDFDLLIYEERSEPKCQN
jgi:hypothetical protein